MPGQPHWLTEFANRACECVIAIETAPPIGCHVHREDDTWEVSLFLSPTEIVGGPHDGERLACLFVVDALQAAALFDIVESSWWQPHPVASDDELGSHLRITGYIGGHRVELRILAEAPPQVGAGLLANTLDKSFVDMWRE